MAIRAEVLQKILSDAEEAKPLDGTKNTYAPDDYQKVMARNLAMGLVNNPQDDFLRPQVATGAVEIDENTHTLKKIGRTQPKLIDVRRYTANRYYKETVPSGTHGLRPGTHIIVVLGNAIVQAIANTRELPPTVKAFRFCYTKNKGWEYVRAEFIKAETAYTMTSSLSPSAAITLMHLIESHEIKSADVEGDTLADILAGVTNTPEPSTTEEKEEKSKEESLDDIAKDS